MNKFLKAIFLVVFSLMLVCTCSSNDDNSDNNQNLNHFLRYTLNGDQINYTFDSNNQINLIGGITFDSDNQLNIAQVFGTDNIFESNKNQISIFIGSTSEISTGVTFSNTDTSNDVVPAIFVMGYFNDNGAIYTASINTSSVQLWEKASITFNQINENSLIGTFSGKLLLYDNSTGQNILIDEVVISNGKFNVPRNNQ